MAHGRHGADVELGAQGPGDLVVDKAAERASLRIDTPHKLRPDAKSDEMGVVGTFCVRVETTGDGVVGLLTM
jgi:hypothetical protein